MGFRDRSRYKFFVTALHRTLPILRPEIRRFPAAGTIPWFPSEAVVFFPDSKTMQLAWISDRNWNSLFFHTDSEGVTETGALYEDGPNVDNAQRTAAVRWALNQTLTYYLAKLDDLGGIQPEDEPVDLTRLFYQDMIERVDRVATS